MATTEIPKNAGETLRVERGTYQGVDLLHVPVWTGKPGDPQARPTQKGLSLRPEVIRTQGGSSCRGHWQASHSETGTPHRR